MQFTHEFLVGFSKSYGLFYLIALSVAITIYAYWPALRNRFDKAANSIFDDEEGPCR
ncbi:cbb3-type cytochrome c oxidase subunit 3 [Paracoccus pacificus]|uniref:Cbb3-type cytochrome c oxidase subunit 3 n=1 Tax=Paracoccus pacificus TaxID=1463598 RepID=A0ABW4R9G4_9RHOB